MSILRPIRDYLRDGIDLQNLVGDRIYAGRVPQGVQYPCLTLEITSADVEYSLTDEAGVAEALIDIDGYAHKEPEAMKIIELVRLRPLSAYRGYAGIENFGRIFINHARIETDGFTMEVPLGGTDRWIYQANVTYRIFYERTKPIAGV